MLACSTYAGSGNNTIEIRYSLDGLSWTVIGSIPTEYNPYGISLIEGADDNLMLAVSEGSWVISQGSTTAFQGPLIRLLNSTDGGTWDSYATISASFWGSNVCLIHTKAEYYVLSLSSDASNFPYPYQGPVIILISMSNHNMTRMQITSVNRKSASPSVIQRQNGSLMVAFEDRSNNRIAVMPSIEWSAFLKSHQ